MLAAVAAVNRSKNLMETVFRHKLEQTSFTNASIAMAGTLLANVIAAISFLDSST